MAPQSPVFGSLSVVSGWREGKAQKIPGRAWRANMGLASRAGRLETLTGIARTLQARGVKTPAGRTEWQPVQVSRLLAA